MVSFGEKKRSYFLTTLILLGFSFFPVSMLFAQPVSPAPAGGNSDIVITAQVLGCGDNIVQAGLGEQCDGLDLNSQTCESLGFRSGTLSCRSSCIFETSACVSSGSRPGGSVRDVTGLFGNTSQTNVVFTGTAEPGSIFFVMVEGNYFTSVRVDETGSFSVTYPNPEPGEYIFNFYSVSSNGLYGPNTFGTLLQQSTTTSISNIVIPYGVQVLIEEPVDEIPAAQIPIEIIEDPQLSRDDIVTTDLFEEFLEVLENNEEVSPEELRAVIEAFAQENGYDARVPQYQNLWWTEFKAYLSRNTNGLSEWYPNVYISFLVPYWNLIYDTTDWFDEYKAPIWLYKIFL